jgi:hypothetical protein
MASGSWLRRFMAWKWAPIYPPAQYNITATNMFRYEGLTETAFARVGYLAGSRGSSHAYKYRLAFVSDRVCVLRYDNEAGKGDHKHVAGREVDYRFVDVATLQTDFWTDVEM